MSIALKKVEAWKVKYKAKTLAVDAHLKEREDGGKRGARQFVTTHGLSARTLRRYKNGGQSIESFNKSKRKLLDEENDVLVEHIAELSVEGFPPDRKEIMEMANEIIQARDPSDTGVGKSWYLRFMDRNAEARSSGWTSSLVERVRANNMNPTTVAEFFDAYKMAVETHNIPVENWYTFDETNI